MPIAYFFLIYPVFYQLLKAYARFAIHLYCTKIVVNKKYLLNINGPVLFAANHPNSFLDGVILSTLLKQNLYSLTRGDVFKNKIVGKILSWLKLLPVYRTSEGAHNLAHNYTTFEACHEIFKNNQIVLIFSEAGSINEWHLRPLRKGTARLAFNSWQQGIDVKIIPLAFNYSSFKKFGKVVHLNFGEEIKKDLFNADTDGKQLNNFTQKLQQQLQPMVYEANNERSAQKYFSPKKNRVKTALLIIPGFIGLLVHAPLFYLCRVITWAGFKKSDHYDGVLTALLFLSYPVYILLIVFIVGRQYPLPGLLLVFSPLLAWCWLQVKHLFE
jgi:1-acyl-sn-glycerol-3-phosphate acyltransferase